MSSLGDSVHQLINDLQNNALEVPAPPESVAGGPSSEKVHAIWSQAHDDLPALVQSMQPKIGDLAKSALAFVASIGGGLLQFLASFIIAGIVMAFGESGSRGSLAIFERVAGVERGAEFTGWPRRRFGPSLRASSASPSFKRSSSASASSSPACPGPAFWR
jgi:predicted PurR-regulated permease PerM